MMHGAYNVKNMTFSFTRSGQYQLCVCVALFILTTISEKKSIFLSVIICCNVPCRNFITDSRKLSLQEIGFFFLTEEKSNSMVDFIVTFGGLFNLCR